MTSGVGKESRAFALQRLTEIVAGCVGQVAAESAPAAQVVAQAAPAAQAECAAIITVGEEILAFASLLTRETQLRRALADPGRPDEGRIALLRSLVGGQLGAGAIEVLVALVGGRWAKASELLNATERLGVEALLMAEDHAGDLAEVEDELFRFGRIVAGNAHLATVLGDPIEGTRRERLIRDLLENKVRPMTLRLSLLALAGLGGRGFAGSMIWLVEAAARRRERRVAYVTSAVPLTAEEEHQLKTILSGRYGGKLTLKIVIDPRVLGGVRVQVGAEVLDGTVLRMLTHARSAMTR